MLAPGENPERVKANASGIRKGVQTVDGTKKSEVTNCEECGVFILNGGLLGYCHQCADAYNLDEHHGG